MALPWVILERGAEDLEDLLVYYSVHGDAELAMRFERALTDTLDALRDYPMLGRLREERDAELRALRSYSVRGFEAIVVFYRVTPKSIDVVRLIHASRDLGGQGFDG